MLMNYITSKLRTINIHANKKKSGMVSEDLKYATIIEGSSFFKI